MTQEEKEELMTRLNLYRDGGDSAAQAIIIMVDRLIHNARVEGFESASKIAMEVINED